MSRSPQIGRPTSLSPALCRLIDALAKHAAMDYMQQLHKENQADTAKEENHSPLPHFDKAA